MNLNLECSRIVLFVKDLQVMGGFYRDVLGLTPKVTPDDPKSWLEFQAGAISIALHENGATTAVFIFVDALLDP